MTQAFNLGQLANKVNTSGQLDASTGLVNSAAVANGGTGRATLDTGKVLLGAGTSQVNMFAGTTTNDALIWNGSAWTSSPISVAGGGGGYALAAYTSPSSYTKPASLKSIKVTIVGGGGTGGSATQNSTPGFSNGGGGGGGGTAIYYAPAPALPASAIVVTAGAGTNSFGALASATAGAVGSNAGQNVNAGGGAGGTATGGSVNVQGARGSTGGTSGGGYTLLSGGQGQLYGGGGAGGSRTTNGTSPGSAGANGIIIIEEFF